MIDERFGSMNKGIVALAAIAVAAALFIALTGPGEGEGSGVPETVATTAAPVGLTVGMTEFAFEPDTLAVQAGASVTLGLVNTGGIEHNFVIMSTPIAREGDYDAANAYFERTLAPGESATVTFTGPAAGTYQIVCSISGHFTAGMIAELTSS
ncbi:MAG TPA: plastocyanin/azurin family copper-binding protein [Acidimicrobiia bacterium]|nr:plastocyanin/azurin family copper-binding protein [Acidimicrobiia bacterium]